MKIEHTIGGNDHEITNNAYLMFILADVWGLSQSKNAKYNILSIETYLHTWKIK